MMSEQKGVTLVELLVVVTIIGLLAAIAVPSYAIYRRSAQYSLVEKAVHEAQIALEAGMADMSNAPGLLWTWSNAQGPMHWGAPEILPGYVNSNDTYTYAQYDPTCLNPWCLEAYILVQHCASDEAKIFARFRDGWVWEARQIWPWGC